MVLWSVTWLRDLWHGFVICDMVSWSVTWLRDLWHGFVICDMVSWSVTWYRDLWHGFVICDMVSWSVTWYRDLWHGQWYGIFLLYFYLSPIHIWLLPELNLDPPCQCTLLGRGFDSRWRHYSTKKMLEAEKLKNKQGHCIYCVPI
jgi:hypothetical protein